MAPLLEALDLTAGYGARRVLHGITFTVEEGGVTTLLGANGAGKTTTLRAVCGMVASRGSIVFAGERIDGRPTEAIVRRGIGHVPEGRGTFVSLSVEENLRLGAYTRRDRELKADFDWIYTCFPRLAERRRQQAGTLSGGEQQMLAIGRALMLRPRLLLLDEASFGLAPVVVEELFSILKQLRRDRRISILLVEQNAALALDLADRVYMIETGSIVLSGATHELRNMDFIRRSYLGY